MSGGEVRCDACDETYEPCDGHRRDGGLANLQEAALTAASLLEQAADTIQLERGEPSNGTRRLREHAQKLRGLIVGAT